MLKLRLRSHASALRFPGVAINTFEVRSMDLNELHCPVRDVPVFADEIAESIAGEGLANPVIVVRGPREDLEADIRARGGRGQTLPNDFVVNCVCGGTNRVSAARQLGYTHIDCVLVPTFTLAMTLQDLQRNSYGAKADAVGTV